MHAATQVISVVLVPCFERSALQIDPGIAAVFYSLGYWYLAVVPGSQSKCHTAEFVCSFQSLFKIIYLYRAALQQLPCSVLSMQRRS